MILRLLTLFLLTLHWFYWVFKAKEANRKKPKTKSSSHQKIIEEWFIRSIGTLVALQLIGMSIFPFLDNDNISYFGFICVVLGITVSVLARREINTNWTNSYEYQIKKEHSLVTNGIYNYIRHPIYTGIAYIFFGAELVSKSYLFLLTIFLFAFIYYWGKREEKILLTHFGKKYQTYMMKTKMFIPYFF